MYCLKLQTTLLRGNRTMGKLTEKKTENQEVTEALSKQFEALNVIADNENKEKEVEKGAKKDKLITFNLPAEDAEKYKMWFGSKGISMSMGLRMCLDYIYYQDQSKNVVLTKSGIRENALNLLK